jgi:prevent-host-death family protein
MSRVSKAWQLQEAKARLSELVRLAQESGPQTITVRGKNPVVLISSSDLARLKERRPDFWAFMRASPLKGCGLMLERRRSRRRDVDL